MRNLLSIICAALLSISLPIFVFAQPTTNITPLSRYGSDGYLAYTNVIWDGDYAYLIGGNANWNDTLHVYDMHDRTNPIKIATMPLNADVLEMQIANHFLYIAGHNGFYILDMTDPTLPVIAHHDSIATYSVAVALPILLRRTREPGSGMNYDDILRRENISNPSTPVVVNRMLLPSLFHVAVHGHLAYANVDTNLVVYDANPADTDFTRLGSMMFPGHWRGKVLSLSDSFAYVGGLFNDPVGGGGYQGLKVVNIARPDSMFIVSSIDSVAAIRVIDCQPNLYVGTGLYDPHWSRIFLFDNHDPTQLTARGSWNFSVSAFYDCDVSQTDSCTTAICLSFTGYNGSYPMLHVVNIDSDGTMNAIARVVPHYNISNVHKVGSSLLVGEYFRLQSVNISNLQQPTLSSTINFNRGIRPIGYRDTLMYAYYAGGINTFNVSNPANPQLIQYSPGPWFVSPPYDSWVQYTLSENVLYGFYPYYSADWPGKLYLFSLANPISPQLVDSVNAPDSTTSFLISGDRLVFERANQSLSVYDLSNPLVPSHMVDIPYSSNYYTTFRIRENYLYLLSYANSSAREILEIYLLNGQSQPTLCSTTIVSQTFVERQFVILQDSYLFFTPGNLSHTEFQLWNLNDPFAPYLAGTGQSQQTVLDCYISDSTLFTVENGVVGIYDCTAALTVHAGETPAEIATFALYPSYPNPFNSTTTIRFSVPKNEIADIAVFDVLGRKVKTLVSGKLVAGEHVLHWDGKSESGSAVASGTYFVKLTAGQNQSVRAVELVK